jgi:hypothetical protein
LQALAVGRRRRAFGFEPRLDRGVLRVSLAEVGHQILDHFRQRVNFHVARDGFDGVEFSCAPDRHPHGPRLGIPLAGSPRLGEPRRTPDLIRAKADE